jgi:hypothetical protein
MPKASRGIHVSLLSQARISIEMQVADRYPVQMGAPPERCPGKRGIANG